MELHFLEARVPLVKTYTQTDSGVEKDAYPMVKQVTSHVENVDNLDQFATALRYHSRNNHCLLKGKLSRQIDLESRAGLTDSMQPTQWVCLDFDYVDSETRVEDLLGQMGLGNVSHVIQYGAGHKIDKPFSAHLFFMLEHDVLPEMLKYWLMNLNLSLDELSSSISLSRSNAALLWPLDISVANNGMLIYVAPPNCKGLDDPVPLDQRVKVVKKEQDKANIRRAINSIDTAVVEERKNAKLAELRKKKGLKTRTFSTKTVSGIEILSKPGVVAVTGHKEARGFMYLNLNGGNSWGYYHPTDNPEILFNFKGEPNYLTKEIVPEYYKGYKKLLASTEQDTDTVYLAFLDRRSDTYYRGTFNPETSDTEIYPTSAVKKLEDFLRQHNQWVGEFVEEWDYVFRFEDNRICVPEERMLNRYQESVYLREARLNATPRKFPPVIAKILNSALGNDIEVVKRFLNWLAFIVQKRRRAETSWVLSGCEGTGKGLLFHRVLAPIIGSGYTHTSLLSSLHDSFNAYMENCVLLMLDETDHRQLDPDSKSMAKLKQAITEPVIPIRAMRTTEYNARNYMNVILASNSRSAISISDTDRRFNVAPYQKERLFMTADEIDQIEGELMDFACILYKWNVNEDWVRTPIQTEQGELMHLLSVTSVGQLLHAFAHGDLQDIIDVLPSQRSPSGDSVDLLMRERARAVIIDAQRCARRGETQFIDRDQFHTLLKSISSDSIPSATNKFLQMMRHHGIELDRRDGELGVSIDWKVPEFGINEDEKPLKAVK